MNSLFRRSTAAFARTASKGLRRDGGIDGNLVRGCGVGMMQVMQVSKRYQHNDDLSDVIPDEQSWVAPRLKAQGEKVTEVAATDDLDEMIELSEENVNQPSEKVKKLVANIIQLNVLECQQMLKLMQKRLGIPDEQLYGSMGFPTIPVGGAPMQGGMAAPAAGAAAAPEAAAPAKEKTVFDIKIGAVDAKAKIKIIKEVRSITGLGLKEAKDLVEKAPVVVKEGVKKDEVEKLQKQLEDAGAAVELL